MGYRTSPHEVEVAEIATIKNNGDFKRFVCFGIKRARAGELQNGEHLLLWDRTTAICNESQTHSTKWSMQGGWSEMRYSSHLAKMRISFSVLLPALALVVWAVLVPAEIGRVWYSAHQAMSRGQGATASVSRFELTLPPDQWVSFTLRWRLLHYSRAIIAVNLPGLAADVLISMPTSQPGKWHPEAVSLDNWRCLVFPFYCLPAWWLAGYGLDALVGRKRIHLAMLWTGSILGLLFAVTLFGYYTSPAGDQAYLHWILPGSWLWTILFAVIPVSWIRQRRQPATTNQ